MLKHLSRSGMDFLLHIFNLFWSSHSFTSIWNTSSIIPIQKLGKPLDSPASFRPISLTSCVSKLFERIILSRLLFILESNSILASRQAGFCPGRSTLDQILYFSQSNSDRFNKPRLGSLTILSTIDFSKAFDFVWHPALFYTHLGWPPSLLWIVGFNLSFLTGALLWYIKITKVAPFESVEMFRKDRFFALYFFPFSSVIFWLLCRFPSAALYAYLRSGHLVLLSLVPTAVEAAVGALFRLEYWCLPLNPSKCEVLFFSVDPHYANLLVLDSCLRFNPTPTFLGVTFDRTLFVSKHVSLLKAKLFPRLKPYAVFLLPHGAPLKESLSPV